MTRYGQMVIGDDGQPHWEEFDDNDSPFLRRHIMPIPHRLKKKARRGEDRR